jgi:anti-sigma factor RsiW
MTGTDMSEPATQSAELSCEQCRELLSGYVDRELTADEQQAVDRHLSRCTRCATESTRVVGLKKVVQHWDGIQGSDEFHQDVLQKLISESQMMPSKQFMEAAEKAKAESLRQTPPVANRSWLWLLVGVLLAAAVAVVVYFLAKG